MRTRDNWGRRKRYADPNAEIDMLPCPFCGSEQVRTHSRKVASGTRFWVQCVCGAKGANAEVKRTACANWNKRASVKPPVAHAFHNVIEDCKPCCCCESQPEVLSYNVGSQIRCTNPKCYTAIGFDRGRYKQAELIEMWNSLYEIGEGSEKARKLRDENNQTV